MSCNCNKPKCDGKCGISPSVLQINNPGDCTLFHRVEVPASMGDSKTNPPKNGDYRNVLLYYVADGTSWLFSSDGIPQKLVSGFTDYEDAINLPQINGETLIGDKSGAELGLQDKLIAGDNIQIAADGKTISATDTTYGPATDDEIGLVKPGDGLSVEADGTLNVEDPAPEDFFDGPATDSDCGMSFTLDNMIGGQPSSLELKGGTSQASYSGKNLMPYPYDGGGTGNGITFTANSDGSVTLNGQNNNSGNSSYRLQANITFQAGTYYFIAPSNTDVMFSAYDGSRYYDIQSSNNYTLTLSAATTLQYIIIQVARGRTSQFNNYVVYPMMSTISGQTAADYEPYVGGAPAPSPSYPQQICSASGEQTITVNGVEYDINLGKNLIDGSIDNISFCQRSTSTRYGNGFTIARTEATGAAYAVIPFQGAEYLFNKTVTVSFQKSGDANSSAKVFSLQPDGGAHAQIAELTSSGGTFTFPKTIPTGDVGFCLCLYIDLGADKSASFWNIQAEEGEQSTDYIEYIDPIRINKIDGYTDKIHKVGSNWYVHKEIGVVDLSSLDWSATTGSIRGATAPNAKYVPNNQTIGSARSSEYKVRQGSGLGNAGVGWFAVDTTKFNFNTGSSTNPTGALYYALASFAETEITTQSLIDQLNSIQLESGMNTIEIDGDGLLTGACAEGYSDNWNGNIENINHKLFDRLRVFNTVSEMSNSNDLSSGSFAKTLGKDEYGDGDGALYSIGISGDIALENGLYATIVSNTGGNNYYDISYSVENYYGTTCYITEIPLKDEDGNEIKPYIAQCPDGPLRYAQDNVTSMTMNASLGNHTLIHDGEVLVDRDSSNSSLPSSCVYVALNSEREMIDFQADTATAASMISGGAVEGWLAYYRLITNGTIFTDWASIDTDWDSDIATRRHPRQCIGIKADKTIVILTTEGRLPSELGLTSAETATIMDSLGCVDAWNLDGGGSTSTAINGYKINNNIDDDFTVDRNIDACLNVKHIVTDEELGKVNSYIGDVTQQNNAKMMRLINPLIINFERGVDLDNYIDGQLEKQGQSVKYVTLATNGPASGTSNGYVINYPSPTTDGIGVYGKQIFSNLEDGRTFFRSLYNSSFTSWLPSDGYKAFVCDRANSSQTITADNTYEQITFTNSVAVSTNAPYIDFVKVNNDNTLSFDGDCKNVLVTMHFDLESTAVAGTRYLKAQSDGSDVNMSINRFTTDSADNNTYSVSFLADASKKLSFVFYGKQGDKIIRLKIYCESFN